VPFVEAYGLTEAADQVTSNPLPPRQRKPGSVGVGTGLGISIIDEEGNHLGTPQRGEVAIHGANIFRGYENDPEANARAFVNGWFRTGDEGFLDSDNYLYLTGRIRDSVILKVASHQARRPKGYYQVADQQVELPKRDPKVADQHVELPKRDPKVATHQARRPKEYYSCFISYSTKDEEFAERLHADLQAKGVLCWFAPHDMKGGRKLHQQIEEAILKHDKLLLILSQHSMNSNWVKTEIASARAREKDAGVRLLFPLTIAPFEEVEKWKQFDAYTGIDSAREVREYFIPDFSNWKEHDSYQKVFQRLLKDLKAEASK